MNENLNPLEKQSASDEALEILKKKLLEKERELEKIRSSIKTFKPCSEVIFTPKTD